MSIIWVRNRDLGSILGLMGQCMREIGLIIGLVVMGCISGRMGGSIMASG